MEGWKACTARLVKLEGGGPICEVASATSPTHDLLMEACTSCSLKPFLASEMVGGHCPNQTVSFSLSVPEKCGILGILFRMAVPDAPGTAE